MFEHILSVIIFLPILAGLLLLLSKASKVVARFTGLIISLSTLVLSIDLYTRFASTGHLEFVEQISWIPSLGISYHLGVDGISLFILMACSVLLPLVYTIFTTQKKGYYANLLIVQGAMAGAICAADMVLFYIFWEIMLLPVFFMLGLYGGSGRMAATLKITIYTIAGSLLMLAAIIYLAVSYHNQFGSWTFAMEKMADLQLTGQIAAVAFFGFMIAFAIKIPLFPFHTWLPDAYTEAPSATTFVLSAIMAKIGVYGVIRFVLPVFDEQLARFALLLAYCGIIGMMYCGIAAIAQKDFKRMLAFSSASHMGIIALGVFCMNMQALTGTIYQIVAHAMSTGVLFLFIGLIEERTKTRTIEELGGIASRAPVFATFFAIAMLASVGLPGTSGFVGEFMIILGAIQFNTAIGILAATTLIIGVCYMLWMFQRIFFERTNTTSENFKDLSFSEGISFLPVILLIVIMGIYPYPFLTKITPSTALQFEKNVPEVAYVDTNKALLPELAVEK